MENLEEILNGAFKGSILVGVAKSLLFTGCNYHGPQEAYEKNGYHCAIPKEDRNPPEIYLGSDNENLRKSEFTVAYLLTTKKWMEDEGLNFDHIMGEFIGVRNSSKIINNLRVLNEAVTGNKNAASYPTFYHNELRRFYYSPLLILPPSISSVGELRYIMIPPGRMIMLGNYDTPESALEAYEEHRKKIKEQPAVSILTL